MHRMYKSVQKRNISVLAQRKRAPAIQFIHSRQTKSKITTTRILKMTTAPGHSAWKSDKALNEVCQNSSKGRKRFKMNEEMTEASHAQNIEAAKDGKEESKMMQVGSNDHEEMTIDDAIPEADDPLLTLPPECAREGDHVILVFGDGRQMFAQCITKRWRGKQVTQAPVKINKRSYSTHNMVGLRYGTVLEVGPSGLVALPDGEGLLPDYPGITAGNNKNNKTEDEEATADDNTFPTVDQTNDNRDLVDNNTAQSLDLNHIEKLRKAGTHGSQIVDSLIKNSSTFQNKTEFSKAKYVARKQKKYQPRCRMVRCSPLTICEAVFLRESRKVMNMREDTLGQILSYSNVSAGCQVLVLETCAGIVTGALAHRMGGYGKIVSIYSGQQPSFLEMLQRFNLSFAENQSIKWLHASDIFADDIDPVAEDPERAERESLEWPCHLQPHTRVYCEKMKTDKELEVFLSKRCNRFARKITRHSPMEAKQMIEQRLCDSIVLVARYDPTATLLDMLPFLAPSSPFVVYSEYLEPLTECFQELKKRKLAINIRLSDTWMREYQVLPGRTHPSMNMSQSGGFILTGIKLCPNTGHNEIDDKLMEEIKAQIGGRRGRSKGSGRKKNKSPANGDNNCGRDPKRARTHS